MCENLLLVMLGFIIRFLMLYLWCEKISVMWISMFGLLCIRIERVCMGFVGNVGRLLEMLRVDVVVMFVVFCVGFLGLVFGVGFLGWVFGVVVFG